MDGKKPLPALGGVADDGLQMGSSSVSIPESIASKTSRPQTATSMLQQKFPSTPETMEVLFHVLTSPEFNYNDSRDKVIICCNVSQLGGYNNACVVMRQQKKRPFGKHDLFKGHLHVKPRYIDRWNFEYYYCVVKNYDNEDKMERLPEFVCGKRKLNVPEDKCQVQRTWNQYDDVIYPEKKSMLGKFLKTLGSGKVLENKMKATLAMLPKWEGFVDGNSVKGSAENAIEHVRQLSLNVSNNWAPEGFDLKEAILRHFIPRIRSFQTNTFKGTPVLRLVSASTILYVVYHEKLDIHPDMLDVLFAQLIMQPEQLHGDTWHIDAYETLIHNHFKSQVLKSNLTLALIRLFKKRSMSSTLGDGHLMWLCGVTLLHFLRNDSQPFTKATQHHHPRHDKVKWYGIEGLEIDNALKCATARQKYEVVHRLHDVIRADHLLPRTLAYLVTSIVELSQLAKKFPRYVTMVTLYRLLKSHTNPENELKVVLKILNAAAEQEMSSFNVKHDPNVNDVSICLECTNLTLDILVEIPVMNTDIGVVTACFQMFASTYAMYHNACSLQNMDFQKTQQSLNLVQSTMCQWLVKVLTVTRIGNDVSGENVAIFFNREFEIMTKLFDVSFVERDYNDNWITYLKSVLETRLNMLDDKQKINLFCHTEQHRLHKCVQDVIRQTAFGVVDKCCKGGGIEDMVQTVIRTYKNKSQADKNVYGILLSHILMSSWPRMGSHENQFTRNSKLLKHIFQWKPMVDILQLTGEKEWDNKHLIEEGRQLLDITRTLVKDTLAALVDGEMKISDFLSLKENEAEFETLCSLICHKTDNLQTLFKCRQQEHSAWKAESQLVHIFYDKTQAILKQDEGTEIKEKLKLSQNEVKFKNICNPNEYSNASVDSYSPAITMYPFTEEQKTMLTTMETYQHSRIMIYFWNETLLNVRQKVVTSKPRLSIKELETTIWTPTLQKIFDLKRDVEKGTITLADIDKVFNQFDRNVENIQTELSMIADGNLGQWVELRTRQIRIYYNVSSVYMAAGIVLNLKETYDLTGDFKSVELLSTKGKDFKNQLLKSITEDLDRTGKMLSGFTKERCKSLQVYIEQKKLIDWVKKEMKGINDMKAFLDLSMRVVGEGDMEVDTIGVLDQAVSGYAPLIFDLSSSDGSTKFLKQCNKLWETLTRDPRLPKKLKETGESLDYLIKLQKSHGEDEETSLNQACNINRRGVYHVGHLECDDYKLDLKSSIRLTVLQQRGKRKQKQDEADAINREYSLDDLKDIQSRLMLISHREEEHSEIVERYITLMDLVIRMAETYLKLRSAGCVSFIDWKVIQHCQPAKRVTTNVFFGASDPMITGSEDAADSMYKLCDFLERCHHQWLEYINRKRRGYYELNHFTMTQIFQLRRDLAKLRNNEDIHPSTCVLLEGVRTNCGITNLREALRESNNIQNTPARSSTYQPPSCPSGLYMSADMKNTSIKHLIAEGMTDKIAKAAFMACGFDSDINLLDWCYAYLNNDDIIDAFYVQYIEQYEDSPMDKTPRLFPLEEVDDTAGTSMIQTPQVESGKQISSVTDQLEALWTHKLESEDAITQGDYITVEHLGKTLECLANDERSLLNRPLKRFIVPGQPNLVICSHENILSFVLSIYMEDTSLPLPTVEEVLLCTEHTTAEAVSLFWHRAFLDTRGGIFCLAFADQLSYEVCSASEHILNKLQSSLDKKDYRVLVICSKERENQSYMVSALDHFKTDTRFVPDMVAITAYLMDKFQEECSITTHDGFSTGMVTDMRSSVLTIQSNRSGTGKSLFVERLSTELEARTNHHRESPYCITLPLARKNIDLSSVVHSFSRCIEIDNETHSIFHLDISPLVQNGIDNLLFNLLVLRSIQDNSGRVWRRHPVHLYIIELTSQNKARVTPRFQDLLPVISCQSPRESLATLDKADGGKRVLHMDNEIYRSDNLQMSYQYLAAFQKEQNLDKLQYSGQATESPTQCLLTLLQYCGVADPSWAELNNFTSFLGEQLKDCEDSVFCDPYNLGDTELEGFKTFVVKFMIAMSKDFATPSVKTSNQSVDANGDNDNGLERFQLRRTWENSPHPYIFFNRDHITMTFLGFTIDEMGNLLESGTGNILEPNVMSAQLQRGLTEQHVDLTVDIMHVSRDDMLNKLYLVFGTQETYDPDPTYELTIDNVKKMMAIHMRFRCGIPVIIMGETGCGKTRLIRFMCDMQAGTQYDGRAENMIIMKVHGGTTELDIVQTVAHASVQARLNKEQHHIPDTVLFFDEANTTEAVGLIKEILCDKRVNGTKIDTSNGALKFVAACNPYRRHTKEMIESLEASGLGYYVRADQTEDTLGSIPMRHLVYRVQPLPPSMLPLVWDFGQLNVDVEKQYILQIVQRFLNAEDGDTETIEVISNIISASQTFMRKTRNECSFVSLRDVERTMNVMVWFLEKLEYLNPLIEDIKMKSDHPSYETPSMLTRALTLSLGVCYHARLQDQRRAYRIEVAQYFVAPCALPGGEQQMVLEMIRCQDVFLNHIELGPNIARNTALRENVFMMIVCLELRIPLFLVGKPGSSKSLAKTIVADAMQGISSKNEFFKKLKQVRMVSYQCSPLSTPEGIISVFRRCGKLQKQQELDNFVSVVVLDELGLAEDSPAMPLKTLHPLLEYGAEEDNTSQAHMRVGFIGISNWALDPAKMNRGILVSRPDLDEEELKESAIGICHSDNGVLCRIQGLLSSLAAAYLKVCEKQTRQFFGLRDFYSLIKMVFALTKISANPPSWGQLEHAVRRNFGGLDEIDIVEIFKDTLKSTYVTEEHDKNDPDCSTAGLIKASLEVDKSIYIGESRYLLLLTENYAALGILQQILNWNDHVIIFGSSFPKDQEYTQICRNIHRIKTCMETGRNVVLLNLENLYESLYDALNQYYVYFGDNRYIDIGLGVLRRKCRVHKDFKLVVIAERQVVYEKFPIPLINRLEKHFLAMASILTAQQHAVVARLEQWADEFANFSLAGPGGRRIKFSIPDAFIGYNQDTPASIVLRLSSDTKKEKKDEKVWTSQVLEEAKRVLLQCATPDAVARLNKSKLGPLSNQIWNQYFHEQHHDSIVSYLKLLMGSGQFKEDTLTQITTHSRLLSRHDTDQMSTELGSDSITVVSLHEFQTEQQFSRKARDFFNTVTAKIKILVIQCSSGNEHTNLIACSRYLIQDERVKAEKRKLKAGAGGLMTAHVVFIIQLPRIVGGCFAGFQGGKWNSIHIDELRPAEARLPEITDFENHSISKMFQIGMESKHKSLTRESDHSGGHERAQERKFVLDTYYVINSCLQTALSMLVDSEDNAHRASERVDLLLKLCKQKGKSLYWNVLQERIYDLLRQKDERGVDIKAWLCNEATSGQSMQENGTFRRALLHKLLRTITHILAEVIAFTDVNDNLSIIENNGEPAWVKTMWFTILGNTGIAPLEYTSFLSPLDVPREHIPVRSTGIGGSKFRCRCPFSWIIKERLDEMWNSEMHKHEVYYEVVRNSDLGTYLQEIIPEAMVSDFSNLYLHDFVRMVYRASQLGEYELIMDEIEVVAKQIHRDMNAYDETHVDFILTPPAIHMAWYKMRLRFESFAQTLVIIPQALQQLNVLERFEEMTIDVYTLTYLLEVLQPDEHDIRDTTARSQWLRKVKESRPLIDKILAMAESYNEKDEITNIYGGKSKRDLGIARTMWNRITVLQLFVEHVCVPSLGFKELNIEHTILLKRMLNSDDKVDFKTLDTLAILETFLNRCVDDVSAKLLKYGIRVCAVCKEAIKDPVLFPCHHIFCLQCVEILLSNGGGACATCRQKLPLYFQPEVSQDIVDAIEKLSEHRRQFNGFFMEIVSRLCFMGNLPPHSDVIERMLTYVSKNTRENENIRSKRMSALVEDCIDPTPVLRSFLLQLILKFRKDHVYDHLSDFLQVNLQFCVDEQDVIELCLLFTQCLEDSYYQEDHHNRTGIIEIALAKLKSGIRPKSVRPSALNISRLEKIAAARFSLTLTAELIYHYFGGSQDQNESKQRREHIQFTEAMKLIDMAKTYCDRIGNKWPRLYLLKQLCRRYGRDVTRSVSGIDRFKWIAPDLLVKHDDVPDRFLVYGDNYESIIDALELSLHQEDLDRDKDILSIKNDKLKEALLLSAMYRILVMLCVTNDGNSNEQEMDNLQKILGNLGANKDVIETIISNTVNGEETFLQVVPKQGGLTRTIAAIVTHVQIMVLYSPRSNLLEPFDFLANHPEVMKGSYLPTMPDDMIMEAREALHAEGLHWFECKNGHPYTIGECGGPRAIGKCSDCGVNIGGIDYKFERGADKEARITDSTQTGHVLGEPTKRSRKSNTERLMSPAATAIIRLLMHSALMVAATKNPKDLEGIFHPKMPSDDVRKFVWHHIECDLVQISHAIGRSVDDAAVTVHMILKRMVLKQATGACQFDARLSSKDDRQLWEELFAKKFVNPSIENLGNRLNEANVKIYSDERMGNCQLLKLLYEVDIDPVKHSLEQLHTVPAMWRYRSRITIQHLSQVVQGCIDTFPVLQHFLKAEHNLRALQYLPDIVRLQQQLFDRYHRNIDESEAIAIRIDRFLESLPVQEQEEHARLISSFCKAWEILRGKIAVSGRLQVSNDMCTRDITTSSNLAVLLPTRKGDGICSTALLDMLIVVHNTFMEEYSNLTDNTLGGYIRPQDATVAHLVAYDTDRDLLPVVISNCTYSLEIQNGQEVQTEYDLMSLEKQLDECFIYGRPLLQHEIPRLVFRQDCKDAIILDKLRRRIPQENVSKALKNDLLSSMESLTDVRDTLACLDICISLLSSAGGKPDTPISVYLLDILKMDTDVVKIKDRRCQLKHIIAVWQMFSVERARQLTLNGQDSFETLSDIFREELNAFQKLQLQRSVRNLDLDNLLHQYYEYIAYELKRKGAIGGTMGDLEDAEIMKSWSIRDTLWAYVDSKEEEEIRGFYTGFPVEIELKHAWGTWKEIVRLHATLTIGN